MTIKRTTHEHDAHESSEQIEQKQHFHIFHHEPRKLKISHSEVPYAEPTGEWAVFEDFRKAPVVRKTGEAVELDGRKNLATVSIQPGDISDSMHGDYYYELAICDENGEHPVVSAVGVLTVDGRAIQL